MVGRIEGDAAPARLHPLYLIALLDTLPPDVALPASDETRAKRAQDEKIPTLLSSILQGVTLYCEKERTASHAGGSPRPREAPGREPVRT